MKASMKCEGPGMTGPSSSSIASRCSRPRCCCPPLRSHWHELTSPLLWQGGEAEALFTEARSLSAPWKVLLLSDGSVTRHLALASNMAVAVECLEMAALGEDREGLPPATDMIAGPLVQRQVLLRLPGQEGQAYVYAASWWNADTVDTFLRDKSAPIWVSLSQERTELYREILQVQHGNSLYLEQQFGVMGPFWGRTYVFWNGGRPLTVIYEVFSPCLQNFLGPCEAVTA